MKNFNKNMLALVVGAVLSPAAMAVTAIPDSPFDIYTPIGDNGALLANATLTPDGGLHYVNGSSQFQGGIGGIDINDGCGGCEGVPGLGDKSAAFFNNLNVNNGTDTIIDLNHGILLTSGNADLPTSNTQPDFTGFASGVGDQGLDLLLDASFGTGNYSTQDSTVLAFNFTADAGINAVSLDFAFGSDEFPEFADSYPEIAAVFVDGVNYASFNNGDLLTVTSANIASGNFFDNTAGDFNIEYDGISQTLALTGLLDESLDEHSIKFAVSDTGDQILDTGLFVANLQGLTVSGADAADPVMPDAPADGGAGSASSFDFTINVGDAGVGIDPTQPLFIDPDVATGYTYTLSGNPTAFATVLIPAASNFGDGLYDIFALNPNTGLYELVMSDLGIDTSFSFLSLGYAVTDFQIQGIETSAMLDPTDANAFITGLTFTNGGSFTVTQTPDVTFVSNVPTPETLWLLMSGLAMMGLRKKQA